MFNHAPQNYRCPICIAVSGIENEDTWIKQNDIFYRDSLVLCFIGSKFIKGNEGHPLIVPIKHYENIYDLPKDYACRIAVVAKAVAQAVRIVRKSSGVTIMQNNEPAGDQHALHYHMHIIPRFEGDNFHEELWKARKSEVGERVNYADSLREYFLLNPII